MIQVTIPPRLILFPPTSTAELLQANLLSPYVLAFGLGVLAKLLKSDLALPKDIYTGRYNRYIDYG